MKKVSGAIIDNTSSHKEGFVVQHLVSSLRKAGVSGDITISKDPPKEIGPKPILNEDQYLLVAWGEVSG